MIKSPAGTHESLAPISIDKVLTSLVLRLLCREGRKGESKIYEKSGDCCPIDGESDSAYRRKRVSRPGDVISRVEEGGVVGRESTTIAGISDKATSADVGEKTVTSHPAASFSSIAIALFVPKTVVDKKS